MAKGVYLSGDVDFDGTTLYPTNIKINEQKQIKRIPFFNTTAPPASDFELMEIETIKGTIEGFMNLASDYPIRNVLLNPLTITFEGYEYDGRGLVTSFNIDCTFDGAIRVTIEFTFTLAVSISEV